MGIENIRDSFATGMRPSGFDFANLINSSYNLEEDIFEKRMNYDLNGNLIEVLEYDPDFNVIKKVILTYNTNKHIETIVDFNEVRTMKYTFTYDTNFKITNVRKEAINPDNI